MAHMNTIKLGLRTTHKTTQIGKLYQVGLNGHGGSENLAKKERMSLHFSDAGQNHTIWLDRDETIMLIKRAMKNNDKNFADLFELASQE